MRRMTLTRNAAIAAWGDAFDKLPKDYFAVLAWRLAGRVAGCSPSPVTVERIVGRETDNLFEAGLIDERHAAAALHYMQKIRIEKEGTP